MCDELGGAPESGLRRPSARLTRAMPVSAEAILELARGLPQLTANGLQDHFGSAAGQARMLLGKLVEEGRLVRHGRGRGTYYSLPGVVPTLGDSPEAIEKRTEAVLELARSQGRLRTRDVSEELGISQHQVRPILADLVDRGLLESHGRKRGRYYTLADGDDQPEAGMVPRPGEAKSIAELLDES